MSFREGLYSGSSVNRGTPSSLALGATLPLLVYPPKDRSKEKEEEATEDMDFLVERPLREVLDTAETYMWLEGFHISLSERTETTSLFSRVYVPKKGFFGTLLSAFVEAPPLVQKVSDSVLGDAAIPIAFNVNRPRISIPMTTPATTPYRRWLVTAPITVPNRP